MPDLNRMVAGLRCRDVLAMLSEYVEAELPGEDVARVDAHLRECQQCEKFGGEYAQLVARLRSHLQSVGDPPSVRSRLAHRMDEMWTSNTDQQEGDAS